MPEVVNGLWFLAYVLAAIYVVVSVCSWIDRLEAWLTIAPKESP